MATIRYAHFSQWMRRGEKKKRAIQAAGRRAANAEFIATLAVVVHGAVGTFLIGFALKGCSTLYAQTQGSWIWLFRPHSLMWLMLAAPIAFSLAVLTYDFLVGRLKGPPPPGLSAEYIVHSMPLPRFIRIGAVVVAALFSIVACLNVPYHVRVTSDGLYMADVGKWTEHYIPFRSIASVALARYYVPASKYSRGGPSRDRQIFVTTKDGTVWTPASSTLSLETETRGDVGRFVAVRSGVPLEYPDEVIGLPTDEEIDAANVRTLIAYSFILLLTWSMWKVLRGLGGRARRST